MRIDIASFTAQGHALGQKLGERLRAAGETVDVARCGGGGVSVRQWIGEHFPVADALVFIGAAGIAVRAVAPFVAAKTSDPAVVVVDDGGRFAISLLSGHIGGANELAERIASLIGAVPVITTATDVNRVFAVDSWAKRNGLAIVNPERIKNVSAALLAGGTVSLYSAFPASGTLPSGIKRADAADGADVIVDIGQTGHSAALRLVPPVAVLGIGCRKGTPAEMIDGAFVKFCASVGLCVQAVGRVCSIDLKKNEPGLVAFCEKRGIPLTTFSAEELAGAEGDFAASEFVKSATGVDNVCERSAVLGSGGRLLAGKTIVDGVAMALAAGEYELSFTDGNGRES